MKSMPSAYSFQSSSSVQSVEAKGSVRDHKNISMDTCIQQMVLLPKPIAHSAELNQSTVLEILDIA
jgi:hypothetical protein